MRRIQPTDHDADFKMMSTPDQWPRWPFLPLVNRQQNRTALLFNPGTLDPTTFLLMDKNLFDKLSEVDITPGMRADALRLRELVDEGWMVD